MKRYTVVLLFSVLGFYTCEECPIKRTPEMLIEKKLRDKLRCNHDISVQPKTNDTELKVSVIYLLHSFELDYEEETLTLYSWNYYDWFDDRLIWNPESYGGIHRTVLTSFDIWVPGMKLKNSADPDDIDYYYSKCLIKNTGNVTCVPESEHKVICSSALKNYPYDTKVCTLKLDQNVKEEKKVIFKLSHVSFVMDAFESHGWAVIEVKVVNGTDVQKNVHFMLERISKGIEASIVVPSFVIGSLTIAALFLDIKDNIRFGILCLNLMSHFLFSIEIGDNLPKHGAETPVILLFVTSSTILTTIVFILTLVLKPLSNRDTQPSVWISFFNDFVLESRGRYLVYPRWTLEIEKEENVNENLRKEWLNFVNIINSVCLIVVSFTYICLFSIYMPRKTASSLISDDIM